MIKHIRSLAAKGLSLIILLIISLYRYLISPLLPPSCRFQPTCSEYAILAIREHGVYKGIIYTVIRIFKCNPLFNGGYDPIPSNKGTHKCQINKD